MDQLLSRLPAGLRASLPVGLPTAAVGVTFGLLAEPLLGGLTAVVVSALVWSGTAQFAALSILGSGGGSVLAAGTGLLANTRFIPMGFAIAPSMSGHWARRLLTGALLADASFVIGHRQGGRFDIRALAWAAPVQYVSWVGGTLLGVVGADAVDDPARWGLDVLFPVFYLSVLLPALFPQRFSREPEAVAAERIDHRPLIAAALAGAITLCLIPVLPQGLSILAAAGAALIGLVPTDTAADPL